jgi:uncharacterized membrane-anchored protein YjiN (DUF445 family)
LINKKVKKKMSKSMLNQKLNSLQSLPKRLKKNQDMSFVDNYSDNTINDICEACYNIVHKKLPLNKSKNSQLKKKLLPIHEEVRRLANPKLQIRTKRRLLKQSQVGSGVFTALASFVIPTLISLLSSK